MISETSLKGSINSVDRQLLYDIRELLKEQNELLRTLTEKKEPSQCQYCGGTHENKGQFLACARKNKKGV